MGLGTDAVAVAEAVGRRRTRPWSVVSRPLFVGGRRGNGFEELLVTTGLLASMQ